MSKNPFIENLYPRRILPEVEKYLNDPGIILLVGARQVGKTSILYLLMERLKNDGKPEDSLHYFDLEDLSLLDILNSGPKEFIAYLNAIGVNTKKRNFIFVDEIQYMANPTNFLKIISDHYKNLKLIVTGSSTLEIRQKFQDSLAGRKVVFELYPLDFYEFLVFKGEKKLSEVLINSDIRHINFSKGIGDIPARFFTHELARFFNEYVVFGGYPMVAMEADYEKKATFLTDIYNSYIKKDIKDLMRIDNITAFNNLIKVLALQVGSLVNLTELCTALKIARETLERYLFLLENTFVIRTVTPFSRNPRKEISKMAKIYFIDTGLRNIAIKNLNTINDRGDSGALVENVVFSNLLKNLSPLQKIHFWRTLAKNEVDFLLLKGDAINPVEVKYSPFKSPRVPLGIKNFQKDYASESGVVLTKDYFGEKDKTLFLPVWLC